MKKNTAVLSAILGLSLSGLLSQEINNPDFSRGKAGWLGDGKPVWFDSTGEVSETASPGSIPGLKVELSKNAWREVRQSLRPKQKESEISFSIQAMADPAFKRLAESKEYSDVDFGEGGGYVWSALVFPKCDFLIRVHDDTWYYRPLSLMPLGTWKTLTADFPKLKARQREIALLFPPGEGTVYLKAK